MGAAGRRHRSDRAARFGRGALASAVIIVGALIAGGPEPTATAASTAAAAGLSKASMLQAVVPSLCGHPAGRLVDGSLPDIPAGMGGLWLDTVKIGRVGGRRLAVASINCNQGGIGWPGNLVMYSSPDRIVGTFPLSDFTRGGRQSVSKVWISKGKVRARIHAIAAPDDNDLWGTRSALATFGWSQRQRNVVLSKLTVYTEQSAATRLVAALRAGDVRTAGKYATSAVVSDLMSHPHRGKFKLGNCVGADSPEWSRFAAVSGLGDRQCMVHYQVGTIALVMGNRTWNTWEATAAPGIAGA